MRESRPGPSKGLYRGMAKVRERKNAGTSYRQRGSNQAKPNRSQPQGPVPVRVGLFPMPTRCVVAHIPVWNMFPPGAWRRAPAIRRVTW